MTSNINNPSGGGGGGGVVSGRSPFPHRAGRLRASATRLSVEGGGGDMTASLLVGGDTSTATTQHSPFAGLLRFSPLHNTTTSATTTTGGGGGGGTIPAAGVSPYNRGRGSNGHVRQQRFFGSQFGNNNNGNDATTTTSNQEAAVPAREDQEEEATEPGPMQDGIPMDRLRTLATQALLDSPSQAIFYANLLYAKTGYATDGLLLAQTYQSAQQHAACLRVLEESGILQSNYPWEGLLLACAALAATQEYTVLLEIVEDACRLTDNVGNNNNNNTSFRTIAATQPLDDDDRFGWDALKESIPMPPPGVIHPLARLCCWRGQAYYEMGHGIRATKYWKRALEMDCQMQKAWESLLQRNLISSEEAYDLIQTLYFLPEQEWLRSLYLANIELTPAGKTDSYAIQAEAASADDSLLSEFGLHKNNSNNNNNDPSNHSFAMHAKNLDASSIHLMDSPLPNFTPATAQKKKMSGSAQSKLEEIQKHVNEAFDKLQKDYKLDQSPQVLAMAARRAYRRYDWKVALEFCEQLAQVDPFLSDAAFCYIATLIMLGYKRVLFRLAHEWVESSPKSAKAWFAVGAYYYCCERYHVAQRHFCRATRLDPQCTEAWIAFGCSFAACDESDQALASFRAAQRLSPGEHTSLLYMGMEYVRTNHLVLANYFLQAALTSSCGADPLCLHELGVLESQQGNFGEAISWFQQALRTAVGGDTVHDSIELCLDSYWEPTLYNLGHCYRKKRNFDIAAACYNRCIALCPDRHSTYSAYAFTKHMQGDLDIAIDYYHQALSCKPEDALSEGLLTRALNESLSRSLTVADDSNDSLFSPASRSVVNVRPSLERKMSDDSDVDMSAG